MLTRRFIRLPAMLAMLAFLHACGQGGEAGKDDAGIPPEGDENLVIVADNIVYDVEILNPVPDDRWTEECLAGLDHRELIDFIFDGIYRGDFKAYGIFDGKSIPAGRIRKMEEKSEFTREEIGKIQFQENWVLNKADMSFSKRVTEVRLGLQNVLPDGTMGYYQPLFRVVL